MAENARRCLYSTSLALIVTAIVGCGGGSSGQEQAAGAAKMNLRLLSDGQYQRLWSRLHPDQRRQIPEALFERCMSSRFVGVDITDVNVKETYAERVTVPGTTKRLNSVAVTMSLDTREGDAEASDTVTYHEFEVAGEWTWAMDDAAFNPLKAGECATG